MKQDFIIANARMGVSAVGPILCPVPPARGADVGISFFIAMFSQAKESQRLITENRPVLSAVAKYFEKNPGPRSVSDAITGACEQLGAVDSWQALAAVNLLHERGAIRFVDQEGPFTQHKRYEWR